MKYKITGTITLEDGAQIENPVFELADNTNYKDGEVCIEVLYYTSEIQSVATLSRFYTFTVSDGDHTRQDCVDKILSHSIHEGNESI